jgi:hypothetical protein
VDRLAGDVTALTAMQQCDIAALLVFQEATMSTMTIRNLDDETKQLLRIKAAEDGVSLEEKARSILRRGAREQKPRSEAYQPL